MKIHELSPSEGSRKARKRVGRGPGSGHGKTSCRGSKGYKSRSGSTSRPGYEGGQMPIHRRLPKRGFTNIHKKKFVIINLRDIDKLGVDIIIDEQLLKQSGLLKGTFDEIKLLAQGNITHPVMVKGLKISKSAQSKIEAAGGKVEM
ncbi:MAG: 50S ribosomal protein L15 [Desulfobacterales bacterium]|nr:50S ribosomal protein L15 [Desulfobacterales bacterium]